METTNLRLGDDVRRIVLLKRGGSGIRRVADSRSKRSVFNDDDDVRVRIIRRGGDGSLDIDKVFQTPKKKQSRLLRPIEKALRKSTARRVRRLQKYLELHDRSNAKKKNGWIRDYPRNAMKALRRRKL